jgi:hypothetical protein
MLRAIVVLLTIGLNATDLPKGLQSIPRCNRAPHAAAQTQQKLAQQCVQGVCCGQVGCWVKCPCW